MWCEPGVLGNAHPYYVQQDSFRPCTFLQGSGGRRGRLSWQLKSNPQNALILYTSPGVIRVISDESRSTICVKVWSAFVLLMMCWVGYVQSLPNSPNQWDVLHTHKHPNSTPRVISFLSLCLAELREAREQFWRHQTHDLWVSADHFAKRWGKTRSPWQQSQMCQGPRTGGRWGLGGEVILHYLGNKWVYCHCSVGLSKVLICARRRPPSGVEISFMATTSKLRLANLSVFNLTLWSSMFVFFSCRSFLSSSLRLSLLKHHNWCSTYVGLVVLMFGFSLT